MAKKTTKAQSEVKKAMHERKHGTLKSGRSGKMVTSKKQAVAIGLSKAISKELEGALAETRSILREEGLIDTFDDSRVDQNAPHLMIGLTAEGQRFSEQIRDELCPLRVRDQFQVFLWAILD